MPAAAADYNQFMGGVDVGDQLIRTYTPQMRCRKLWKKIVLNFIMRMAGMFLFYFCTNMRIVILILINLITFLYWPSSLSNIFSENYVCYKCVLPCVSVNAYILYKSQNLVGRKMSRKNFMKGLIHGLVGDWREGHSIGRPIAVNVLRRLTERDHHPRQLPGNKRRQCAVCYKTNRRRGSFEGQRVRTWCPKCRVGLCSGRKDCFVRYHTMVDPTL